MPMTLLVEEAGKSEARFNYACNLVEMRILAECKKRWRKLLVMQVGLFPAEH